MIPFSNSNRSDVNSLKGASTPPSVNRNVDENFRPQISNEGMQILMNGGGIRRNIWGSPVRYVPTTKPQNTGGEQGRPATGASFPTHIQTQVTTPYTNNRLNYLMQGMQGVPGFNNDNGDASQFQQQPQYGTWNAANWSAPQQPSQNAGFGGYGATPTQQTNPYMQSGQNPYLKQNTVVF